MRSTQQKLISNGDNGSGKPAKLVQERRENGSCDGVVDELDVDRRIVVAVGPSWAGPRSRWGWKSDWNTPQPAKSAPRTKPGPNAEQRELDHGTWTDV